MISPVADCQRLVTLENRTATKLSRCDRAERQATPPIRHLAAVGCRDWLVAESLSRFGAQRSS